MVEVTPEEFARRWNRNLKASSETIRYGVQNTDKDPPREAIKKKEKLKQRFIESIDNGTWENELGKVSKAEWQDKMINVGIPRVPAGADSAMPEVTAFASALLPKVYGLKKEIEKMPDLTLQDSINRMTKWVTEMAKFQWKGRR